MICKLTKEWCAYALDPLCVKKRSDIRMMGGADCPGSQNFTDELFYMEWLLPQFSIKELCEEVKAIEYALNHELYGTEKPLSAGTLEFLKRLILDELKLRKAVPEYYGEERRSAIKEKARRTKSGNSGVKREVREL